MSAQNFLWALNLTLEPVLMIGTHNSTHGYFNSAPGQKTELNLTLFPDATLIDCLLLLGPVLALLAGCMRAGSRVRLEPNGPVTYRARVTSFPTPDNSKNFMTQAAQAFSFEGRHILSVGQFDRDSINRVFTVADRMEPYAQRRRITRVLEGAILSNMFFEPSTRTRISFGSAFNLLGGEVRETTEVKASSLTKGESLYDTARVLSGYSDLICMRHPQAGSVAEFAEASRVPVINGGDGPNEHPSQALLDLYTIRREMQAKGGTIDGLKIAFIGDLKYGRAAHSLSKLLGMFDKLHFKLVSPKQLATPPEIVDALREAGHTVEEFDALEQGIHGADILYVTRTQEERFPSQEEADRYRGLFRLNQQVYTQHCEPNTVIMHPLPRDSRAAAQELDDDLNSNPNLAIFRQTDNGVLVRMALFALILGVADTVSAYERPVPWVSNRR